MYEIAVNSAEYDANAGKMLAQINENFKFTDHSV